MQTDVAPETEDGLLGQLSRLAHRLHLPTTLVKFLIVGGIGFLINQFILFLGYDSPVFWFLPDKGRELDLGLFSVPDSRLLIASVVAVEIAIVAQFNFHDRWTFRQRNREGHVLRRFLKFNVSSAVSPIMVVVIVNAVTPVIRDAAGDGTVIHALAPYLANTVGVLCGFTWNWTLNSMIIWPHERRRAEGA